jgi:hypothetical protein
MPQRHRGIAGSFHTKLKNNGYPSIIAAQGLLKCHRFFSGSGMPT